MQLLFLLATAAALVVSEVSPHEPVSQGGVRLLIAICGVLLVTLYATLSAGVTSFRLRRDFQGRREWLRRFARMELVHRILWLSVAAGILYGLGWTQLVRFNWRLNDALLMDEVLILMPVVLPMVLAWFAYYEVDRAVDVGSSQIHARPSKIPSRRQYVGLHVRYHLMLILVPVAVLLAVQDVIRLIAPTFSNSDHVWLLWAPLIAALFVGFPIVIKYVWETEPLSPGPLRDSLESIAYRSGLAARDILIWPTAGRVVAAAVTGIIPGLRYLILTDALIDRLNADEIQAIVAHEAGHVQHGHFPLRTISMMTPLALVLSCGYALPEVFPHGHAILSDAGLSPIMSAAILVPVAMAIYALLVFGPYSRLLERQADLFACRQLSGGPVGRLLGDTLLTAEGTARYLDALEKLNAACGQRRNRRSWLHPSVARRVDFLVYVAASSRRQRLFHRKVQLVTCLMLSGFAVCLVCPFFLA